MSTRSLKPRFDNWIHGGTNSSETPPRRCGFFNDTTQPSSLWHQPFRTTTPQKTPKENKPARHEWRPGTDRYVDAVSRCGVNLPLESRTSIPHQALPQRFSALRGAVKERHKGFFHGPCIQPSLMTNPTAPCCSDIPSLAKSAEEKTPHDKLHSTSHGLSSPKNVTPDPDTRNEHRRLRQIDTGCHRTPIMLSSRKETANGMQRLHPVDRRVTNVCQRRNAAFRGADSPRPPSSTAKNPLVSGLRDRKKTCVLKSKTSVLSPTLVVAAVTSLYNDRIRPLLVDVLQRVKSLAKKEVQSSFSEGSPSYQERVHTIHAMDIHTVYASIQKDCSTWIQLIWTDAEGSRVIITDTHKVFEGTSEVTTDRVEDCFKEPFTNPALGRGTLSTSILSQLEAELLHPPSPFLTPVDPRSMENPYSVEVWRAFCSFLIERLRYQPRECDALSKSDARGGLMPYQFKGGRYGLAVELQNAKAFPRLQRLSLGELCHIVQLAISARVLAYERSVLQPVASCVELSGVLLRLEKPRVSIAYALETTSSVQCPSEGPTRTSSSKDTLEGLSPCATFPVQNANHDKDGYSEEDSKVTTVPEGGRSTTRASFDTVEEVAYCLHELLQSKPEGFVIAQLKKVLFTRYGKEILPEKFGYHKLTECLRGDPIISSVCHIVSMDPSAHRLLIVARAPSDLSWQSSAWRGASSQYEGSKGQLQQKMFSSPSIQSPGSQSTAVPSDSCGTPECMSPVVIPSNASRCIVLPEGSMEPPMALRTLSYDAWKTFGADPLLLLNNRVGNLHESQDSTLKDSRVENNRGNDCYDCPRRAQWTHRRTVWTPGDDGDGITTYAVNVALRMLETTSC